MPKGECEECVCRSPALTQAGRGCLDRGRWAHKCSVLHQSTTEAPGRCCLWCSVQFQFFIFTSVLTLLLCCLFSTPLPRQPTDGTCWKVCFIRREPSREGPFLFRAFVWSDRLAGEMQPHYITLYSQSYVSNCPEKWIPGDLWKTRRWSFNNT